MKKPFLKIGSAADIYASTINKVYNKKKTKSRQFLADRALILIFIHNLEYIFTLNYKIYLFDPKIKGDKNYLFQTKISWRKNSKKFLWGTSFISKWKFSFWKSFLCCFVSSVEESENQDILKGLLEVCQALKKVTKIKFWAIFWFRIGLE